MIPDPQGPAESGPPGAIPAGSVARLYSIRSPTVNRGNTQKTCQLKVQMLAGKKGELAPPAETSEVLKNRRRTVPVPVLATSGFTLSINLSRATWSISHRPAPQRRVFAERHIDVTGGL